MTSSLAEEELKCRSPPWAWSEYLLTMTIIKRYLRLAIFLFSLLDSKSNAFLFGSAVSIAKPLAGHYLYESTVQHTVPSSRAMTIANVQPRLHKHSNPISLSMWSQDDDLKGSDRIKACVPYILPLLDGDQFGHYIYYTRFPILGEINDFLLGPLIHLHHKIPYLGVGLFILLTLGTRFNTDISRNVRFSAQQAALIDVALIFPELIWSCFAEQPLPRYIVEPCNNFIWYAYMSAIIYSVYSNLKGQKPDQIPFISPSAELMVGPF